MGLFPVPRRPDNKGCRHLRIIHPENPAVSHSHLPVAHLLKQVELYRSKRQERDVRPVWLSNFINAAADLFEPLTDVGRVGFDCRLAEECWEVGMFLGTTEIVGGRDDGQARNTDFEFNLLGLLDYFEEVTRLRWNAVSSQGCDEDNLANSHVLVEGRVGENSIRLLVFAEPPRNIGPGLRKHADGRCETA